MTSKKILLLLAFISAFATAGRAQVDLLQLGSTTFSIDPGSSVGYTQTTNAIVFNLTLAGGETVYNDSTIPFTTTDWSAYSGFEIKMTLLGGSPTSVPFSVGLFDSSFNSISLYDGSTDTLTTVGSTVSVPLTLSLAGNNLFNDVQYLQITWNGSGAVNTDFQTMVGVPEPSTYALLAISGLAFGGYVVRRRRA